MVLKTYNKKYKCTYGGIDKFYIMPFTEYKRSEIGTYNMELTTFPETYIYLFECEGSFTQQTEVEGGDVFINQKVSINLSEVYGDLDISIFLKKEFRILAKTNNGYYLMFGLRNGMECSASNNSGSSKSEFNGFSLDFASKEEEFSPYLDSLDGLYVYTIDGESFNYDFNFDI